MADECGDNYFPPEEATSVNTALAAGSLAEIAGIDFLYIDDANTHASLDCYSIFVHADAVFNEILVGGINVVTAKGLSGKTIVAGTLLPFGDAHATSIDLVSGSVVAYIY